MRYLLASDLDGTIYRNRKTRPEDLEMILEWQRQGHIFCLCSGRSPFSATNEMQKCGLTPDLLITVNGAAGVDMGGNYYFKHFLPDNTICSIYELGKRFNCQTFAGVPATGVLRCYCTEEENRVVTSTEESIFTEKDLFQFQGIFKTHPEDAKLFSEAVNRELPQVTAHRNGAYIDCTLRGVDKASGVAEAAAHFGIDLDHCYTIGDNGNDLPMLVRFHGAVIEDGDPHTIATVGKTVEGVASFIKEILCKNTSA